MLMFKFVVPPGSQYWDAIRMENPKQFVCIYRTKGFEVDENSGSFFLVVSRFFDDASKHKNLRRCRW